MQIHKINGNKCVYCLFILSYFFHTLYYFFYILVLVQEEITGVKVEPMPIEGEEEEEGKAKQGK